MTTITTAGQKGTPPSGTASATSAPADPLDAIREFRQTKPAYLSDPLNRSVRRQGSQEFREQNAISVSSTSEAWYRQGIGPIQWTRHHEASTSNLVNKMPANWDTGYLREFGPFRNEDEAIRGARLLVENTPSTAVLLDRPDGIYTAYVLDEFRYGMDDADYYPVPDDPAEYDRHLRKWGEATINDNTLRGFVNVDLSDIPRPWGVDPNRLELRSYVSHEITIHDPAIRALVDQREVIEVPESRTISLTRHPIR